MIMQAIETSYKGYKFRSRLEARWAVFFDRLGVAWEYEPEGFVLEGGVHYLPDFRIRTKEGVNFWYEVKPVGGDADSKMKLFKKELEGVKNHGLTVIGDPVYFLDAGNFVCPRCGCFTLTPKDVQVYGEVYLDCYPCDFVTPYGSGNPVEPGLLCKGYPHKGAWGVSGEDWENCLDRVRSAAEGARSARFEHKPHPL